MKRSDHALEEQTLVLAAIVQALLQVDQVAREGRCDELQLRFAMDTLFVFAPEQSREVYGKDLSPLHPALERLHQLLDAQIQPSNRLLLRYLIGVLTLERQLRKRPELLAQLRKRLEHIQRHQQHFADSQQAVVRAIDGLYQDTLSTLRYRLQIQGDRQHLGSTDNAAVIRTLLLCAVRSAMLWQQIGGRRWRLLWHRRHFQRMAQHLYQQI